MRKVEKARCFSFYTKGKLVVILPREEDESVKYLQENGEFNVNFQSARTFQSLSAVDKFLSELKESVSEEMKKRIHDAKFAKNFAEFGC